MATDTQKLEERVATLEAEATVKDATITELRQEAANETNCGAGQSNPFACVRSRFSGRTTSDSMRQAYDYSQAHRRRWQSDLVTLTYKPVKPQI